MTCISFEKKYLFNLKTYMGLRPYVQEYKWKFRSMNICKYKFVLEEQIYNLLSPIQLIEYSIFKQTQEE